MDDFSTEAILMNTVILCCRTIESELQMAMEQAGVTYPCVWVESGLHNVPAHLTSRLQQELDALDGKADRILMGFGFCGNSVAGLTTGNHQLIIPRVDDCISLSLGSYHRRQELMREDGSYFLTQGWLKGERNIWVEYEYACKRYGKARARDIYHSMLCHYRRLLVVDTGAYDLDKILPTTEMIARELRLRHEVVPGSMDLFCRLLTGPWDADAFLTVEPHTTIQGSDLWLKE